MCIRELSASEAVLAGGRSSDGNGKNSAVPWIYAPDGAGLVEQLLEVHVLPVESD